jgi:hypothetical protein
MIVAEGNAKGWTMMSGGKETCAINIGRFKIYKRRTK